MGLTDVAGVTGASPPDLTPPALRSTWARAAPRTGRTASRSAGTVESAELFGDGCSPGDAWVPTAQSLLAAPARPHVAAPAAFGRALPCTTAGDVLCRGTRRGAQRPWRAPVRRRGCRPRRAVAGRRRVELTARPRRPDREQAATPIGAGRSRRCAATTGRASTEAPQPHTSASLLVHRVAVAVRPEVLHHLRRSHPGRHGWARRRRRGAERETRRRRIDAGRRAHAFCRPRQAAAPQPALRRSHQAGITPHRRRPLSAAVVSRETCCFAGSGQASSAWDLPAPKAPAPAGSI